MKSALIAAVVVALVASGGTYAATRINGAAIQKHSIPANRLTPKAVGEFTAATVQAPRALAAAVSSTLSVQQVSQPVVAADSVTASCPDGYVAITGGYQWTAGDGAISSSWLAPDGHGWTVQVGAWTGSPDAGGSAVLAVYVSCEPGS